MSGIRLSMVEQMELASCIGERLASIEAKVVKAESRNLSAEMAFAKGQYHSLYGAYEKISSMIFEYNPIFASRFITDVMHSEQHRTAELRGELTNA